MNNLLTDVEVPERLEDMTENRLRILRDRLIVAGLKKGGVDLRLPRVVEAFQAAVRRRPQGKRGK